MKKAKNKKNVDITKGGESLLDTLIQGWLIGLVVALIVSALFLGWLGLVAKGFI